MPLKPLKYHVYKFGNEHEPVVVIDGFSGTIERLKARAYAAKYTEGPAYFPGIQAAEDPNYLGIRGNELTDIISTVFGVKEQIRIDSSAYAIVTTPRHELVAGPCLPHYDGSEKSLWACLHYIQGPKNSGTAFYRLRLTGFERGSSDRIETYRKAWQEDVSEHGLISSNYFYGDDERYELIGEVQSVPDRLIICRGFTLHSGCIPINVNLNSNPSQGRITLNSFLST